MKRLSHRQSFITSLSNWENVFMALQSQCKIKINHFEIIRQFWLMLWLSFHVPFSSTLFNLFLWHFEALMFNLNLWYEIVFKVKQVLLWKGNDFLPTSTFQLLKPSQKCKHYYGDHKGHYEQPMIHSSLNEASQFFHNVMGSSTPTALLFIVS